ncbi:MAG: hypothetical protein LBC77_01125 [Spirochaetaceae bacterium]|jgi:hypothetical protein|nr:hypothetical protein [Spirochaetaceae bacterium]
MSQKTDWMPGTRGGQLNMAKDWNSVMTQNAAAWSIPAASLAEFDALIQTADGALLTAHTEAARTVVTTAQCKAAFEELTSKMRDIKRRYFLEPPLTDADLLNLGLKPRDSTHTISGPPTAQVTIETYLVGRRELGLKIVYITGGPHETANKGYRIYYRVAGQGEAPPERQEDLNVSFFTKRKKELLEFGTADSGKTAYFAVQVENEGKKGPWGPLVSALIP